MNLISDTDRREEDSSSRSLYQKVTGEREGFTMRNMYQCEKCGKVFADYDECYNHEGKHWEVCNWYKQYEKASSEFTQYSEKQDAPSVVGVELQRWDSEKGETVHAVAVYHLKEFFTSDKLTSDDERQRQEEEARESEC